MKSGDPKIQEEIREIEKPGKAKRITSKIELRPDWEMIKCDVMLKAVEAKFTQNEILGKRLLATGDCEIIEGNTWHDNTWGNCTCEKCSDIVGTNYLGHALMTVRECLKEGKI